jgi:hypothetical protein
MVDTVFGLPAHPFFVHAPLVLSPLVALAVIAVALRPAWCRRFGIPTLVAVIVVFAATFLARESGESLDDLLQGTAAIGEHETLADATQALLAGLVVLVAALVGVARFAGRPSGAPAWAKSVRVGLSALNVVVAVLATVWMVRTGHSGAESHWTGIVPD